MRFLWDDDRNDCPQMIDVDRLSAETYAAQSRANDLNRRTRGKPSADSAGKWLTTEPVSPTPDHSHHQQQTQQTFHVQLHRWSYPDGTKLTRSFPNPETGRSAV